MCRYTCPKRRRRRAQRSARQNGGRGKEGITDRARGLFKRRVMQEAHDFLGGTILFKSGWFDIGIHVYSREKFV